MKSGWAILTLCMLSPMVRAADDQALPPGVAPASEFQRIATVFSKEAPSQEVINGLYEFMERYPRDPRSDQVQYWVGLVQQRRKFHNEAVKELGFVISDFPASPLVLPALRAQIDSFYALDKPREAEANYAKIMQLRPASFSGNWPAASAFRDALLFTAQKHLEKKEVDPAVKLLLQLPDRSESLRRVVHIYEQNSRHDEAMAMIRRLPKEQKQLAYRLTLQAIALRPGTSNLYALLNEVLKSEPANPVTDNLVNDISGAIGGKGADERDKVLTYVAEKYPRLRRDNELALCSLHPDDLARLLKFIGDYRTGTDVEKVKVMVGELHEKRGDAARAREAYWLLDNKPVAHFYVAATYYGKLAKTKDLAAGQKELTEIVKRFYSRAVSAEALCERADLEAGLMNQPNTAIRTLREMLDRFPKEGPWPAKATFRLCVLLRDQKKYDEAITAYERLIRDYPESAYTCRRAYMEIAECHEAKKDASRAIALYRLVLRKYPHTNEASQAHTILERRYNVPDTDVTDR